MSYIKFKEAVSKVREGAALLDPNVIEQLITEHNDMFVRFCPVRLGGRVRLTKTPIITPEDSWGWRGSKHFLIAGLMGTVEDVYIYKGKFRVGVIWDNQTWINSITKEETKTDPPGIYTHDEEDIEVIK